jgi:DnaK suppressor protein
MDDTEARHLLDAERDRLIEIRDGIERDGVLGGDEQTAGEAADGQHPGDVGTDVEETSQDLGQLESIEAELGEIEDALARLEAGTYGRCEVCGKPIPDERLAAQPTARYDVEHQSEIERRA